LIKKEFVKINGKIVSKTGYKLKLEQEIDVTFPEVEKKEIIDVDFDVEIIYEDEYILVINKPSNLVVHDAPSVKEATLVDWLKQKNISLSTISGEERHGIVHRLDKGTSGVMVVAKTNEAHVGLSKQLEDKSMGRIYLAITDLPLKDNQIIEGPIARNPNNRLKMGIVPNGKNAKSAFIKLALSKNEKYELISAKLFTGRTHQIRVHLSSINRHILGDDLYGFKGDLNKINRVYLHAYNLYLFHPITNEKMDFLANIPSDINDFLNKQFDMESINEKIDKNHIINSFSSFC
jgi:23S rRNA pseudouridine1911/1915/1917 synthase